MLTLALEMEAELVLLDDRLARAQAESQGLAVTGTVGVLLAAARRGLVDFPTALHHLLKTGFRLRSSEVERALAQWRAETGCQE